MWPYTLRSPRSLIPFGRYGKLPACAGMLCEALEEGNDKKYVMGPLPPGSLGGKMGKSQSERIPRGIQRR